MENQIAVLFELTVQGDEIKLWRSGITNPFRLPIWTKT